MMRLKGNMTDKTKKIEETSPVEKTLRDEKGRYVKGHINNMTDEMKIKIGNGNKGKKRPLELRKQISEAQKGKHHSPDTEFKKGQQAGENNNNWKGDDVKYSGIHMWVRANLGFPDKCVHCGKDGLSGKKIHWANISGKYLRDLSDWLRLCVPCHKKFDLLRLSQAIII